MASHEGAVVDISTTTRPVVVVVDKSTKYSKNWLLTIKNNRFVHNTTWRRFLSGQGMQTWGVASYTDEMLNTMHAFCVFKSPRNLANMMEKLGDYCLMERLESKFILHDDRFRAVHQKGMLTIHGTMTPSKVFPCTHFDHGSS